MAMAAAVIISDDVIVEILAKLPVKSLLRFICVCKIWYYTISDPQFCNNLHRMRSCFLLCESLRNFSTVTTDSLLTFKDTSPTPLRFPLPLPWGTEPDGRNIFIGSCNGLICVDHQSSDPERTGLIVWNPSTRKFKRLPRPTHYLLNYDIIWTYVWFGYDEFVDDYKLIWLSFSDQSLCSKLAELEVFTLKSNTWERKSVEHIAAYAVSNFSHAEYGLELKTIGVLSHGAIHWIINCFPPNTDCFQCILAVDLATEKFRRLNFFPHAAPLGGSPWVGSLGGCLCVCSNRNGNGGNIEMDLWVMTEYGVESSWTKFLSIPLFDPAGTSFLSFYPFLFSKGKEIVAVYNRIECWNGVYATSGRILKFRFEERVASLLCVPTECSHGANKILILYDLHMESLVRI